jgi:hypothetical protein
MLVCSILIIETKNIRCGGECRILNVEVFGSRRFSQICRSSSQFFLSRLGLRCIDLHRWSQQAGTKAALLRGFFVLAECAEAQNCVAVSFVAVLNAQKASSTPVHIDLLIIFWFSLHPKGPQLELGIMFFY